MHASICPPPPHHQSTTTTNQPTNHHPRPKPACDYHRPTTTLHHIFFHSFFILSFILSFLSFHPTLIPPFFFLFSPQEAYACNMQHAPTSHE